MEVISVETQKKLVELGFTEDKPGHFTLGRQGYVFNAHAKSEKFHTFWMTVQCGDGLSVGWPLEDSPGAVEWSVRWFSAFVDLNAGRKSGG